MADHENVDLFEKLPDNIIFIIIASLSFKEAARTSVLAKRWRYLWRAIKNIEFNQWFFLKCDDDSKANREIQTNAFVDFVREWMNLYMEPAIDSLSLTFSTPTDEFPQVMDDCIEFALAHHVKSLCLDFSDPAWDENNLYSHPEESLDLPLCVYGHQVLASLTLFSCEVCTSGLSKLCMLRRLSLGWIGITQSFVKDLFANCPLLEYFSLKRCWGIDQLIQIQGPKLMLKTLVIDRCNFIDDYFSIYETPRLRFLKYAGTVITFDISLSTSMLQEVDLDFGFEDAYIEYGDVLHDLLCYLNPMKVLTVCSYLLQVRTYTHARRNIFNQINKYIYIYYYSSFGFRFILLWNFMCNMHYRIGYIYVYMYVCICVCIQLISSLSMKKIHIYCTLTLGYH